MTKRIYKYNLSFDGPTHLELSGPIVHIAVQHGRAITFGSAGELCIWAEAGVHPIRARVFEVYGPGHEVPSKMQHVGSAVDDHIGVAWHVYEPKS